jgi:hypothetical protein
MTNLQPQDPAPWAAKILALNQAVPFQAFSVVMVDGHAVPVTRPEFVEVTDAGNCAEVTRSDGASHVLALEWVVDVALGGEVDAPPRPPRYAAKLRALQENGPDAPLVLTLHDGREIPLEGPHELLLSRDGRSVAVCVTGGGLLILATAEITDLAPGTIPNKQV